MNSNDLHELETIAAGFQAPGSEPLGTLWPRNVDRHSQWIHPESTGRRASHGGQSKVARQRVESCMRANFAASPSQVRVDNGEMDSASRGRVTFKLATALQQWSLTKTSPFQLQLSASQINAADLLKAAGSTAPVAGTLSADVTASGTQLAPSGPWHSSASHRRVLRASRSGPWICSFRRQENKSAPN